MNFLFSKLGLALIAVAAVAAATAVWQTQGSFTVGITLNTNPNLQSGLVGHWTFDGNSVSTGGTAGSWKDMSGQGNHGTPTGFTSTTTVPGKLGQALTFDGVNDYVNVGGTRTLTSATFVAWVKRTGSVAWAGIVFSRGTNVSGMGMRDSSGYLGYHWNDSILTFDWNSALSVPLN